MCDCPDARRWRAYWTAEAIAERLAHEIALYRRIVRDAVWWGSPSTGPVPPRVESRFSNVDTPDSFAGLEARRAAPYDWRSRTR